MYPTASIWILIILAFVFAMTPFLTERAFLLTPWQQSGEPARFFGFYFLRAVISYGLIAAGCWSLATQSGNMPFMIGGVVLIGLTLYVAGVLMGAHQPQKHVATRLLEVLGGYFIIGAVGFAIEANYANPAVKDWQFYAIGACLYVVLGYPGFVWRHLMRHPHRRQAA